MNFFSIIFAILISLTLIGGAVVSNMVSLDRSNTGITVVKMENQPTYDDLFLGYNKPTSTPSDITETDIISRQLFSDYIELKERGQASTENLISLAEQYAENLLTKEDSAPITKNQLKVVIDTNTALQTYDRKIAALRAKYRASTGLTGYGDEYSNVFGKEFIKLMSLISLQYKLASEELLTIEVPSSLADNHLNLANNYFMSSIRLRSIAQIGEDPVSALAAMSDQSKNAEIEEGLIANIRIKIISKGLSSNL